MQCPACKVPLQHQQHGDVAFESCPQCGGIYVDARKLHGLAVNVATDGQLGSQERLTFKPRQVMRPLPDSFPALPCPQCGGAMREFNYACDSNIFVDRCDRCGGIWLDPNEIIDIAKHVQYNPKIHEVGRYLIRHTDKKKEPGLIVTVAASIVELLRKLIFG